MRTRQLVEVFSNLDPDKRIKFQNGKGWGNQSMAANAVIEQGNTYIVIWACHPKLIKDDLKEGQKLIWYNPNCGNASLVKEYFPDYKSQL